MNISSLIHHALAIGQRAFFVLLAVALLSGVAGWLFAPDLKTVRPEIEAFLQEELELKELSLGELSWYWAGNLGLKADASSFTNRDATIVVRDSRVTVQISTMELLSGRFTPSGIRLTGGVIDLVVEENGDGQRETPSLVTLEDTELHWHFGEHSGQLDHFTLFLDTEARSLRARIPGAHINVRMGAQRYPEQIDVSFSNLDWLPQEWKGKLNGSIAGEAALKQDASSGWTLDLEVTSMGESAAVFSALDVKWAFDSLKAELMLTRDASGSSLAQIEAKSFEWKLDRNMIRAAGLWDDGKLQLSATSPHLEMPLVWNSLKPLGSESWHAWLANMQQGIASEIRAEVELMWAEPWQTFPSKRELDAMHYHLNAHVEEADIALGTHEESLTRTEADVEIDESGLNAIIISTQLPRKIGSVSGGLHMPWATLMLDITGHGEVDAGKVYGWMDQKGVELMQWSAAPADTSFSIQWWIPGDEKPRKASINLKPMAPWSLAVEQVPVRITSGEMEWVLGEGIKLSGLKWSTPHLNIKTDIAVTRDGTDQWQVRSLQAEAEGKLERLASYFLLPIELAGGQIRMALDFDGEWHGNIDLKDASWENFLGMKKVEGEDLNLEYSGIIGKKQGHTMLLIKDIHSMNKLFRLHGSGEISETGLRMNLDKIETASFSGAIDIRAPFGPEPWELGVDAAYLNRNALPVSLSRDSSFSQKPWALRANLERFVWDDAEIRGVSIKLASALNSVAVLKAVSLRSGELSLSNLSSIFSLPGGGAVDLRSFEAEMDGQHLKLSATLTPESKRGMHWRGFAELDGNFGHMMKRAELSNIFEGGDMYVLFSGQGEFFSKQPWWQGLNGRIRMRVDDGRIQKGGTLTKFLAAISLMDLPALFFGSRDDLTKPGIGYKRLQMEATIDGKDLLMHKLVMRSSAMDVAGKGVMDIDNSYIDLMLVVRPFQNLDALLSKVPIVRDMFGGAANSLLRKIYRMHGPIADADVESISAEEAGLVSPGAIERFLKTPVMWFGKEKSEEAPSK